MATEVDGKSLVEQLEGRREPPVPAYRFGGGVVKYERANHNPFKDIPLENEQSDE